MTGSLVEHHLKYVTNLKIQAYLGDR